MYTTDIINLKFNFSIIKYFLNINNILTFNLKIKKLKK